ncbi:MAG: hypothetical protein ACUVR0_09805 [Candidatus Aminicenantales bacterium]
MNSHILEKDQATMCSYGIYANAPRGEDEKGLSWALSPPDGGGTKRSFSKGWEPKNRKIYELDPTIYIL